MPTPPIIASFIASFAQQNELTELTEDKQFEHLVAWLLFRGLIHERVVTEDVTTDNGETGIDGAAVVLDGHLVLTAEDAEGFLKNPNLRSSSVSAEIHFFQAKLSQKFSREEALGFGKAVVELLGDEDPETPQDDYLLEVRDIYLTLVRNASKIDLAKARCILTLCTLGEWQAPTHAVVAMEQIKREIERLEFFGYVDFKPLDRNGIRTLWTNATRQQEATLPTIARFPYPAMPGVDNAVVALVRATHFVDSVVRDDKGVRRIGIFDQNIRDFEGLSNSVNSRMNDTIQSAKGRARFGVMNNGITIVAQQMSPAADSYVLRNYQIINGCQTSNVLDKNRTTLTDDVLLQVRLIQTTSPDVLNDVVEATNSQTSVPRYQFVANSKVVVETYEFFRAYPESSAHRLHFERRKSELLETAGISNTRIVTIPDLARAFAAVFLEEPHTVARAPNQVFADLADKLFLDSHLPLMYYAAAFAHYRFSLLKVAGKIKIPHHRLYWHVLTCAKRLAAGSPPTLSDRRKQERYCHAFLEKLWQPADALALFEKAYTTIQEKTTGLDRDRLRRASFTREYLGP